MRKMRALGKKNEKKVHKKKPLHLPIGKYRGENKKKKIYMRALHEG